MARLSTLLAIVLLADTCSAFGLTSARCTLPKAAFRPRVAPLHALDATTIDVGSVIAVTNVVAAQVFGLDTNPYGGKSTFSQADSAGDLNLIIAIAVIFPTCVQASMRPAKPDGSTSNRTPQRRHLLSVQGQWHRLGATMCPFWLRSPRESTMPRPHDDVRRSQRLLFQSRIAHVAFQ